MSKEGKQLKKKIKEWTHPHTLLNMSYLVENKAVSESTALCTYYTKKKRQGERETENWHYTDQVYRFLKCKPLRDLILASRYVPLRIASSISCIFFKLSSPSACQHTRLLLKWRQKFIYLHTQIVMALCFLENQIEETVYQRLSIERLLKYPFYFCVVLKSSVKLCKAPICVALVLGFRTARVVMCTQARVSHLLTNRVRAASTLSKQTSQNEHAEHKG